jgi:hypothetical protein
MHILVPEMMDRNWPGNPLYQSLSPYKFLFCLHNLLQHSLMNTFLLDQTAQTFLNTFNKLR